MPQSSARCDLCDDEDALNFCAECSYHFCNLVRNCAMPCPALPSSTRRCTSHKPLQATFSVRPCSLLLCSFSRRLDSLPARLLRLPLCTHAHSAARRYTRTRREWTIKSNAPPLPRIQP